MGGAPVGSIDADIIESSPDFDSSSTTGDAASSSFGAADVVTFEEFSLTPGDFLGTATFADATAITAPSSASHTRYDYIYMDIDNTAGSDDIEIFFDFEYGISASLDNSGPGLTTADIFPFVGLSLDGGIFEDILAVGGGLFT